MKSPVESDGETPNEAFGRWRGPGLDERARPLLNEAGQASGSGMTET